MEKLEKGKYIIFLDIDGTIYDNGIIPEKTVKALARAKSEGHKIFINSGRMPCIMPDTVLESIKPDGIVGGMGTVVRIGDEQIACARMDSEEVEYLIRFGEEHGYFVIVENADKLVIMNGTAIETQNSFIASTDEYLERYADLTVSKIAFMNPVPKEDAEILSRVRKIYNHTGYAEIPAEGYNKATAIEQVCRYYGADTAYTIAMGDSINDEDMLRFAGIGVAMGNSSEYVKSISDYVTTPCLEGGVADALDALIFAKEK